MPFQYGVLTGADNFDELQPLNVVGQQTIYDVLQEYLTKVEADTQRGISALVEGDTENFAEKYALPGGSGMMQRRGPQSAVSAVKVSGTVDVGYPLEDFADGLGWNDINLAYMSIREFDRQVNNIEDRNRNTIRFEMLKSLFTNVARTFTDENLRTPTITVQSLANGDAILYPPTPGNSAPATENNYLITGYLPAAISNTNNPVKTAVSQLLNHFGDTGRGSNIAYFCNTDVSAVVQGLSSFHPVSQIDIIRGVTTDVVTNVPTNLPGVVRGRLDSGAWLVEWLWIPAGYALAVDLEVPAPLKRRVDPAVTGLPRGLTLVATDKMFPFTESFWRNRYGFGVGNRLNGIVQQFTAAGPYVIPTVYA